MSSDNQDSVFVGVCFIYGALAVLLFTIIVSLLIGKFLESQGVLLFLRDILGIILSLLSFFCWIIAPLIGSILIVRETKDSSIGIRSIIYSFLPFLLGTIFLLLISIVDILFNPDPNSFGRFAQSAGVGVSGILLLAVLSSLFASLFLLKLLARIYSFSVVKDSPDNSQ